MGDRDVIRTTWFEACARAIELVFLDIQKSMRARRDVARSRDALRSANVLVFRRLARRFLEERSLNVAGDAETELRKLEAGLFPPFAEPGPRIEMALAPLASVSVGVDELADAFHALQEMRAIEEEDGVVRLRSSLSSKKRSGAYYTDRALTGMMAAGVAEHLRARSRDSARWLDVPVCDNSCGSGNMLRALIAELAAAGGSSPRDIARRCVYGIDRDPSAVWMTRLTIALQTARAGRPLVDLSSRVIAADALLMPIRSRGEGRPSYETAFPEVFRGPAERRGFGAIIGNPPWETIEPRIQDFYKFKSGEPKAPSRRALDRWLGAKRGRAAEYEEWADGVRAEAAAVRTAGLRFQGKKVFTSTCFIERALQTLRPGGFLSYVVKLGFYGDSGAEALRGHVFRENRLEKMWIFKSNRIDGRRLFPRIDANEKFAVLEALKGPADAYVMKAKSVDSFRDLNREFAPWQSYDIPGALDALQRVEVFDSEIRRAIAEKARRLSTVGDWGKKVTQELNLTTHRGLFGKDPRRAPIFRGDDLKPFATRDPRFFCRKDGVARGYPTSAGERVGVNDIVPNSRRKLRASPIPAGTLTANSVLVVAGFSSGEEVDFALGVFNSFLSEYVLRSRLSNIHVNVFRLKDLPVPAAEDAETRGRIARHARRLRGAKFDEGNDDYLAIEALVGVAYGLDDREIRGYLLSFDGVGGAYADEVVARARDLRQRRKLSRSA